MGLDQEDLTAQQSQDIENMLYENDHDFFGGLLSFFFLRMTLFALLFCFFNHN